MKKLIIYGSIYILGYIFNYGFLNIVLKAPENLSTIFSFFWPAFDLWFILITFVVLLEELSKIIWKFII